MADPAILPFIRQHVTIQDKAGGRYCQLLSCSLTFSRPPTAQLSFSRAELAPFVPPAILDTTVRAEFRQVCPVFIAFNGDSSEASIHNFITLVMALTNQYGGCFSQIDFSDKGPLLVIWFGAPIAYENNVERAAECLLALKDHEQPLRWRAGLTWGIAWAGIRGGVERCEYGVVGDIVNLAARLTLTVAWGDIGVSDSAYERLHPKYQLDDLGLLPLKGKSRLTHLYRLIRKKALVETFYSGRLIGRTVELATLRQSLQPIFSGRFAGIIYVDGETGIGKSRLVHELDRQWAKEGKVCWAYCPADAVRRSPFAPFKHFLRRYFQQSAEQQATRENEARFNHILDSLLQRLPVDGPRQSAAAQLARELAHYQPILATLIDLPQSNLFYEQLEPRLRFQYTLIAFTSLIKAEAVFRPVILQLEDGHWFDEDSRQMVDFLTRHLGGYAVAIICAARPGDDGQPYRLPVARETPQHVIEVGVMPDADVRALAEQRLQGRVTPGVVAFLTDRTSGNPLFVEQLALDLHEQGLLTIEQNDSGDYYNLRSSPATTITLPIHAILVSRLDRLAPDVKQVVQLAAVLGREFEAPVLSQLWPEKTGLTEAIQAAQQAQIWSGLAEQRYLFKHDLLREAAYQMQLSGPLRRLHRQAAVAIENVYAGRLTAHYTRLVYHYAQAEEVNKERYYTQLAGEQAAAQYANAEALRLLGRALELTPSGDHTERYALLLVRERVYDVQGQREAQQQELAIIETLAATLADPGKQAEVALRQANYAESIGDYEAAITAAQRAIKLARTTADINSEATGYIRWGRSLSRQGKHTLAQTKLEYALTLACGQGLHKGEADSLLNLGIAFWHQGHYAEAGRYFEQALPILRQLSDRRGESALLVNLGAVSHYQRAYDAAQTYYKQGLQLAREIDNKQSQCLSLNNLGSVCREQGAYEESIAYFKQAVIMSREIGDRRVEALATANLGLVIHHQEDNKLALTHCRQALQIAREIGNRDVQGKALTYLGHALVGLGERRTASAGQ